MRFVLSLTLLALALLAASRVPAAEPARPAAVSTPKTVLVLSSERADLPSVADFEKGLRKGLAEPGGTIELFVEFLDFGRFPKPEDEQAFRRFLRERYGGRRVDVVVPFQESAFEFLLAHRAELFPGVPVVAAGIERHHVEGRALSAGVTTIPIIYDYRRTLDLALSLQPQAREVLVIHGVARYDLRRGEDARRALDVLAPKLPYRVLSGVPLPAIEDAVRNVPADTIVLFLSMVRDAEGRSLVGQDYARRLAAVSPVPIYGTFGSHVEQGTLGGAITDFGAIGHAAAPVVAAALSGRPPTDPIAVETPQTPLRVNWRALQKWRIPPGRVPREAEILFREPGVWEAHRGFVLGTTAAVLLQAALIAGLLLQSGRRRRAEAGLRQSEENLRLAVAALPLAILLVNRDGTIVLANAQVEQLLGYGAGELIGQPVDVPVPQFRRVGHAAHRDAFISAPQARPMAANRDLTARRKDGTEIPVEIGLNPIRSGTGLLVLAAIVDLRARNELRRKQQELEHVTRVSTMGEIAASLAHELSQPLAAILSNAQAGLRFFERGDPDPQEIREILQDVVTDDKRAGEVVSALRTMLRRGKTETTLVDAAQAASDVLAIVHGELVDQHIEIETALEPGCFVQANKTQVEQVLLNLVMNGMEAMRPRPPSERRMHVTVSRTGGSTVRVAIRDSGVGIPADELDRVFEAFWTTKPAGMGMGLSVCSSIVRSYGGALRVEPNDDRGVTFVFTLPLAPGDPSGPVAS